MRTNLLAALLAALPGFAAATATGPTAPLASTRNGTYRGRYLAGWDQDVFLGMPYAQPPTGPLRFHAPLSVNTSFGGVRDATAYGSSCMQYHSTFNLSEDCLTLNVVRPAAATANPPRHGPPAERLPVLVWIYGGGLYAGSTADPQYNLSGIVRLSQDMGQPVLAVSLNYRLGMYGFLQTPALLAEGSSNAGLLDQRLALRWVQENIAAFGGDPARVVVWGESAGAQSIAYHMVSYGGSGAAGLFRAAILESGGPTGAQVQDLPYYTAPVANLTAAVGCTARTAPAAGAPGTAAALAASAADLACLRRVPADALFAAAPSQVWNPLVDGAFLAAYPSQQLRDGRFAHVPLLTGANSDEGASFSVAGADTEQGLAQALLAWRMYALSPPTVRRLLALYPDDPCNEPPFAVAGCTVFPDKGRQWRRSAAIGGDLVMIAGRRRLCALHAAAGLAVFSYRFDTRLWNKTPAQGVAHFDNVAFSFQNISGLLGPGPQYAAHAQLARAVGAAYINFVHHLDPNPRTPAAAAAVAPVAVPHWPRYDVRAPTNMVWNATSGPFVEPDTFRAEGIAYINTFEVSRELLS